MKKLLRIVAFTSVIAFNAGAVSVDRGKISEIYTDNEGHVGIKITGGFVNAEQNGECAGFNGWVGLYAPHEYLVEGIFEAKRAAAEITVVTDGCEGPTWIKLVNLYQKTP